ncbi:MAG: site-specific integrase [Acidobacteriia bacterium]|nr:site-specific integrase [Terriglobia bacterium]
MARRRYQKGRLFLRGRKVKNWIGRWREDMLQTDGTIRRSEKAEVLGTLAEYPTRKLAQRALDERLAIINNPAYRARPTATFAEFATRWESTVLPTKALNTRKSYRSHLRKHINPFFGSYLVKDIQPELVQAFISRIKLSPKTLRNIKTTFQSMWASLRAWRYVAHDPTEGLALPRVRHRPQAFFSAEEVLRILAASSEPYKTLFWLAAETGMRAGELCGVRADDLDLERGLIFVRQSASCGKLQAPKTENAIRRFSISPQLIEHLQAYLLRWRPNAERLLFATRNGTPWDQNMVVKRKLHPILDRVGIPYVGLKVGLKAFRHANMTFLDRIGAPLKIRQERVGHTDSRVTLGTYTHIASEDDRRVAEALGKILSASCNIGGNSAPMLRLNPTEEQLVVSQGLVN